MSNEAVKKYELRDLSALDIFAMSRIVKKIGIANFKKCFDSDSVKGAIAAYSKGDKTEGGMTAVGVEVAFEIADVIFDRLPECETELYTFLSSVAGLKIPEIQKLPMADFFEMVIEVIKKPEFKDFFKVASRLFT